MGLSPNGLAVDLCSTCLLQMDLRLAICYRASRGKDSQLESSLLGFLHACRGVDWVFPREAEGGVNCGSRRFVWRVCVLVT